MGYTLSIVLFVALLASAWRWRRQLAELRATLRAERERHAALREQQQQSATSAQARELTLFNSMVEGVLILDGGGRIRMVNQAVRSLFGTRQELVGQTLIEAFRLEDLRTVADQARAQGQLLNHELELPGLARRYLLVNATTLPSADGSSGDLLIVFHDLTRLKQLENTRREFVANVSHELRTPLSMIKGFAETLLSGAKDDPAVASRFLQTIEKHADRLTFLIEDLLTLSCLESRQIALQSQLVELRPVADLVVADLQGKAQARATEIENRLPRDLAVRGDAQRLQQVFFNLVDNAVKYGRPGGVVRIEAQPIASSLEKSTVKVQVKDDGPGIPPEAIPRIFERFYRVDKSRSREQGGTGLGLAIVKHIVQLHGGEVWVESEPGKGATFCFTLPLP
jgi:two-component system phosphate regulon sensor histidine kinase PhoR